VLKLLVLKFHVLPRLVKFVVVDGSMYVDLNMIYYNGISFTRKNNVRSLEI